MFASQPLPKIGSLKLLELDRRAAMHRTLRMSRPSLRLTPHGHLVLESSPDAPEIDQRIAGRLSDAFARGGGYGLLQLGAGEVGQTLPPIFLWWRGFAARYVAALCLQSPGADGGGASSSGLPDVATPTEAELASLVLTAPMMAGAEYLTPDVLRALWQDTATALGNSLAAAKTDLQSFLKGLNPAWNLVGRVHFNLAENRRDEEAPFAFMATYTTRLSAQAKAQHLPLGQALREYAGAANRQKLLSLLVPVQRAAEKCDWLKPIIDAGEIFHPLRWTPREASRLLASAPDLENAGVVVRMPATWRASRPPRPQVTGTVGARAPSAMGLDALLDFRMDITLDGETLSKREIAALLSGTDSLVLLRGQWVEVDRERLERAMQQFHEAEQLAARDGLTFAEAMRMLAGAAVADNAADVATADWSHVTAGPWLAETLQKLRGPNGAGVDPGPALHGVLRPYQQTGVQWLHLLSGLGLGACLADDMGLGKTIQVLALLLAQRRQNGDARHQPSLLVAPASLLANWAAEIEKFAPELKATIAHPSAMTAEQIREFTPKLAEKLDLAITSYGSLLRMPVLAETEWRFAILDEARAIKNPNAKQTRAAKALKATARIALTGTPVENHLGDLWSIFDFSIPGLLGSGQFKRYAKGRPRARSIHTAPARTGAAVHPAPHEDRQGDHQRSARQDRGQSVLQSQPQTGGAVCQGGGRSRQCPGSQRRHPAQGHRAGDADAVQTDLQPSLAVADDNAWAEEDSGKLARLREIAEVVASRQEKMLVFTQFREMTAPLATFLGGIFGRPGLVLHGETEVRKRRALVQTSRRTRPCRSSSCR